ncbi:MAG TPA: AarF/UbiB family protein [Gemmatimonadales bacterium]|nr:AarF/UbiB family protein [Gemmatimonadales bacterium]
MRFLVVTGRLFPFLLAFLLDRRRFLVFGRPARRRPEHHRRRADRLTATLAGLGPTFIKLAQVFGTRADILPEPYLGAIATLADRVPPLAPGVAESVIQAELGRAAGALFERFEPAPLAAASLGQVHRARWEGREIVVKVLRPGVEDIVAQDLDVSFKLLFALHVLFPNHHVRAARTIVEEFAKRIEEEMDFREEARNAETLRRNLAADPRVVVPEAIPALTTRRVLALEYVEGTRIDRLHDRLASGELRLEALVDTLAEVYLRMMLVDGFFHADPHPGNLLVDPQGRVVLLDFGMVSRVDKETRARILRTVLAAVRQDVDGVINGFYELGILDPDVDRGTVRDAARQLLAVAARDDLTPRRIQVVVEQILETFYQWPLMLPSDLVYFGRAGVLVEGIGMRYDPNFNAAMVLRPVVQRMGPELLQSVLGSDPKATLRDWGVEAAATVRVLRDLLHRVEREELKLRAHPRDVLEIQRFLAQQVRRALLAVFAFTVGLIASILYLGTRRLEILVLGLLVSFGMFAVVFVLPSHLFQNPLRFRPRAPRR